MHPEDERCADARRISRFDDAFRGGDLDALRARRWTTGAQRRADVPALLRLLLAFGADPNGRGINDDTPLHMAVAGRDATAVGLLLEAGADPALRTRIDDCETPAELAVRAGFLELAAQLAPRAAVARRRLWTGLTLVDEVPGGGEVVRRGARYRLRLRVRLAQTGAAVRWTHPSGAAGGPWLEDDGETLVTEVALDRRSLVNGLFYGLDGIRVGGMRRLAIAPHLAYAGRGVPGRIPPDAALDVEVTVLEAVR